MSFVLFVVLVALAVRLHQRLPRRGELDRDRRRDARPDAEARRRVGRVLQLRGRVLARDARREDDRQGHREPGRRGPAPHLRGSRRRDRLEPPDVVVGPPVVVLARPHRRLRRRGRREGGPGCPRGEGPREDARLHRPLSRRSGCSSVSASSSPSTWIFRRARPEPLDKAFRKIQLVSAAAFSFGHGMNDAQKTMGIIAVLLFSTGHLKSLEIPFWIVLICHAAIGLGTLTGGWRIVRTMGMRITQLKPIGGFVRGVRRRRDADRRVARRHPRLDDAHDHGRDHGRRLRAPAVGRALGRRADDRHRVDPDDSGIGVRRRARLARASASCADQIFGASPGPAGLVFRSIFPSVTLRRVVPREEPDRVLLAPADLAADLEEDLAVRHFLKAAVHRLDGLEPVAPGLPDPREDRVVLGLVRLLLDRDLAEARALRDARLAGHGEARGRSTRTSARAPACARAAPPRPSRPSSCLPCSRGPREDVVGLREKDERRLPALFLRGRDAELRELHRIGGIGLRQHLGRNHVGFAHGLYRSVGLREGRVKAAPAGYRPGVQTLTLARGREAASRRRHPWLFSGSLVRGAPVPGGTRRGPGRGRAFRGARFRVPLVADRRPGVDVRGPPPGRGARRRAPRGGRRAASGGRPSGHRRLPPRQRGGRLPAGPRRGPLRRRSLRAGDDGGHGTRARPLASGARRAPARRHDRPAQRPRLAQGRGPAARRRGARRADRSRPARRSASAASTSSRSSRAGRRRASSSTSARTATSCAASPRGGAS